MKTMICNSTGKHEECFFCGASKLHYKESCEPCPFIVDAKCIDINLTELKALTWKEPFATLMLHDKIETRYWKTNYRGWVLICASKAMYRDEQVYRISGALHYTRMSIKLEFSNLRNSLFPNLGNAIALGRLIDCRPMTEKDEAQCYVKYQPDLYCHIYENVLPIKPFPWKGKQGWSIVPDEIIQKIEINEKENIQNK